MTVAANRPDELAALLGADEGEHRCGAARVAAAVNKVKSTCLYTSIGTSSTSRAGSAFLPLSHGSSASGGLVQLVSFVFLLT